MSSDPLRTLWDALERADCKPHGKEYEFRARCPGHRGENASSLSVRVGADGRAVLWCHAHQCRVEQITDALGLSVHDLFPPGHYRARREPRRRLQRSEFDGVARDVVNVLFALEAVDEPWTLMLTSRCPACGSPGAWLRASSDGAADADCPEGCDFGRYVQGLLARAREKGRAT